MYSRPETENRDIQPKTEVYRPETESYRPEAETYCKKAGGEGWGGEWKDAGDKDIQTGRQRQIDQRQGLYHRSKDIKTRERENERHL